VLSEFESVLAEAALSRQERPLALKGFEMGEMILMATVQLPGIEVG
jgi:hypothetical protein